MKSEFIIPRFTGQRFSESTLPVDVARDLAAYQELVIELAKRLYLDANPQRKRVPRGFEDRFNLHIDRIDEGSSRPVLSLVAAAAIVVDNPLGVFFDQARDLISQTISSYAGGGLIPKEFPLDLLDYFNTFGRSLRDDETLELPQGMAAAAVLTPKTRRELILAGQKEYSENVKIFGSIEEVDYARCSFRMRARSEGVLQCDLPLAFASLVREASGRPRTFVYLEGVGVFDAQGNLRKIAKTTHVDSVPNVDLYLMTEHFRPLKDGWLDGKGKGVNEEELGWLLYGLSSSYPENLDLPVHIVPTGDGGVLLEWIRPDKTTTAEFVLPSHKVELQTVYIESQESEEIEIDLDEVNAWNIFFQWLHKRAS